MFNAVILFFFALTSSADEAEMTRIKSLKYFDQAAKVFQHPRCLNCHPAGDMPSQGMDLHQHTMNVKRGPEDHGAIAMQCSACHQAKNNSYSGVPGAPHWKLAPKTMAWQGLSVAQLCRQLKDPNRPGHFAGGMTKEEFIKHNTEDKLVGWGWHPGGDREPVPDTQKKFGKLIENWITTGAECPE
jgi:hypothetical protein